MKLYGLIGYPLSHSFSERYFKEKFIKENIKDSDYKLFPLEDINRLPDILNNPDLKGLNVTIPYKEKVLSYLDELSPEAQEIKAVNTIKILKDKTFKGYNTDIFGFENTIKPELKHHHNKALILGTGGASKSVQYVLRKLNISFSLVSRKKEKDYLNYSEIDKDIIDEHAIIINTTPLGMFPEINNYPDIPYQFINENHLLIDLIYNPEETIFLKKGRQQKAKTVNGLKMLHLQAEKAWEIWNS